MDRLSAVAKTAMAVNQDKAVLEAKTAMVVKTAVMALAVEQDKAVLEAKTAMVVKTAIMALEAKAVLEAKTAIMALATKTAIMALAVKQGKMASVRMDSREMAEERAAAVQRMIMSVFQMISQTAVRLPEMQ